MTESRVASSGIMLALFALTVILLPFNALPYFKSVLREMANEGAFYPMAAAAGLYIWYLLHGGKISLPKHSSLVLLALLVAWTGISGAANFLEITNSFTKGRSGVEKYIFQYILLLFVSASSILVYQLAMGHADFLLKFRRYAAYSLIPVSLYCVVEIFAIFGNAGAIDLLQSTDYFIRDEEIGAAIFRRLRSVSGEPSYFAMYVSFVFPWVFSYLITERKHRWLYLALMAYLTGLLVLTLSRSAYGVLSSQVLLLLLGVMFYSRKGNERWGMLLPVVTLVVVVAALSAFDFIKWGAVSGVLVSLMDIDSISNLGRYGSQAAAFSMAVDNPIFGIGFGQYGFKMPDYVPVWARISPEIQEWMSPSAGSAWAPALGLYARVAGELGFVGLCLWIAMWISLLLSCYRRFKLNSAYLARSDGIGLALLVSLLGILMIGFNSDSLRFFGYWILLGLCWSYLHPANVRRSGA